MNILLVAGGLQALAFADALRGSGCEVSAITADYAVGRSRRFRRVDPSGPEGYAEAVERLLASERFDLLVPMSDRAALFLGERKDYYREQYGVRCAVPDGRLVALVSDKAAFMHFCQQNGIPHPPTSPLSADTLGEAAAQVGFPAMVKPDRSVGARGIVRVDNMQQLRERFPSIEKQYGHCSLQRFVDNRDYYYNVMMYRDAGGRVLGFAAIRIVRMYPVGAGSSTCCVSVDNQALYDICAQALAKLGWVGMADFDVLHDPSTDEYFIIEINPRVPASLRAATVSGVNFPQLIVADALGLSLPQVAYTPGKTLRYLGTDLLWFARSAQRFGKRPSWFRFFGREVYYQDILRHDPSTWYSWLVSGLKKLSAR